jgi:GR25 family glycosyltransferase involved in LPS biosynthesis
LIKPNISTAVCWNGPEAAPTHLALGSDAQAYVISMADRPERLQQFRQDNPSLALPLQTQYGVDGRNHWPWIQHSKLIQHDRISNWSRGAIGCALSHLLCWKTCVNTNRPTFVFEDDTILSNDWLAITNQLVENLQGDFDIVLLGWNLDSALRARCFQGIESIALFEPAYPNETEIRGVVNSNTPRQLQRLNHGFGLPGYLISPNGAQKLLELCTPIREETIALGRGLPDLTANQIDCLLNNYYPQLSSYVIHPPIALARNDQATSGTRDTPSSPMEFGYKSRGQSSETS